MNDILNKIQKETNEIINPLALKYGISFEGINSYEYKYETILKVNYKKNNLKKSALTIYINNQKDDIQISFIDDILKDVYTTLDNYKDDLINNLKKLEFNYLNK